MKALLQLGIAVAGTLFIPSCTWYWNVKRSPSGYSVPTVPMWRLKSQSDSGKSLEKASIRPDPGSLYVLTYPGSHLPLPPSESTFNMWGTNFMRFWPNGRVMKRGVTILGRLPTGTDGDEISGLCSTGYYRVNGNRIEVEIFHLEDNGSYNRWKGTITEAGIEFDSPRPARGLSYVRLRLPEGAMRRQPDW